MISVCMATYNGEPYIRAQIDSILCQLNKDDEIVISDDESTDSTVGIIESIGDSRIRLVHHKRNKEKYILKYAANNFEYALKKAKGDIVFLSDQDDVWLPNKIRIMCEALKTYELVVSDCIVTDSNLEIVETSYFKLIGSRRGILKNILKNTYLGCCMAFKRELLKYALPIPKGPIAHDCWLGLVAEKRNSATFLDISTLLFRRHKNNTSTSGSKSKNSMYLRIYCRLCLIYNLLKKL